MLNHAVLTSALLNCSVSNKSFRLIRTMSLTYNNQLRPLSLNLLNTDKISAKQFHWWFQNFWISVVADGHGALHFDLVRTGNKCVDAVAFAARAMLAHVQW